MSSDTLQFYYFKRTFFVIIRLMKKNASKLLIHTALLAEAKPLIGRLKLQKEENGLYMNDEVVLCVSGIGKEKTIKAIEKLFKHYCFSKAFNIGIAGCKDTTVSIGTLFCTNRKLEGIKQTSLSTVNEALEDASKLHTTLVDMEADAFLQTCHKYLYIEQVYVFKVVSDYLDATIPTKGFVSNLIQKNLKRVLSYV